MKLKLLSSLMAVVVGLFGTSFTVNNVSVQDDCELAGCIIEGEHTHDYCGVEGCTIEGEHTHDYCCVAGCTIEGEHIHNYCGIEGCTMEGAHIHERLGHHHGSGHGNRHH